MHGKQLGGFMQQVTAQAADFVQPTPTMHRPSMNVTNSPVKPMQWQQTVKQLLVFGLGYVFLTAVIHSTTRETVHSG